MRGDYSVERKKGHVFDLHSSEEGPIEAGEELTIWVIFHKNHASKLVDAEVRDLVTFGGILRAVQYTSLNDTIDAFIE